jgi:pyruvate/2-oxoglutarate/acetoin dehydrogenase E1 component
MREIRLIDGIREAMQEEMRRDPNIFVYGEGIGPRGGNFNETLGMAAEFGVHRLIDTPISELGFTGMAIGAALTGLRPIVDIMFWDFAYEAAGQLINQAARIHYMSNGQFSVPLVFRGVVGIGGGAGGHHSAVPYPMYAHFPGLKVVAPATPYDAKGLLKTAIRDNDPVLVFEHRGIYSLKGMVPDEEYTIPLGVAKVQREGTDVTIVALARMVQVALQAADVLAKEGVSVEVVDPRSLAPLDKDTILASIRKTSRVLVVDEAYAPYGVGGEIAALAADEAFYYLDAPIKRLSTLSVPAPASAILEAEMVPTVDQVVATVRELMNQ